MHLKIKCKETEISKKEIVETTRGVKNVKSARIDQIITEKTRRILYLGNLIQNITELFKNLDDAENVVMLELINRVWT